MTIWQHFRKGLSSLDRAHLPGLALLGAIAIVTLVSLPRDPSPENAEEPRASAAPAAIGGPFALSATNGETVTDKSFPGKYLLVFFGYTYCPDVCPTTLTHIADALERLGPLAAQVQPLFVTVDPGRDTIEALRNYVAHFDPRILGLTGTPAQIESIEKAYKVYAAPFRTGEGAGDYLMDHSAIVYVMDPKGAFIGQLDQTGAGPQMAETLTRLISGDRS